MSTLNKKLPKVSDISWMNSSRGGLTDTITMPFGGVIPSGVSYFGWKQSSYTYSYQVQYMVTARLTPSKQLSTGTTTSSTGWKYANPKWSGNVDTMNKSVAADKRNKWYRYYNTAGLSFMTKGSYDKLQIKVRVRSFNSTKTKKKGKTTYSYNHGYWYTKTLTIKCVPTVSIVKIIATADGGFNVYINTGSWKRGDSKLILNDVHHVGESKENKRQLVDAVDAIGDPEEGAYPIATFNGSSFNSAFKENDQIVISGVFRTCDGVDIPIDGTYTIENISPIIDEPNVKISRDDDKAELTVTVSKSDPTDDWDSSGSWLNVTTRGKVERLDPVYQKVSDDSTRVFKFNPPLDSKITLGVKIQNNLGGSGVWTYGDIEQFSSNGRIMLNYTDGNDRQPDNGMFYGSKVVAMNYETEYSTDASRQYETEIPFGRTRPVAFMGNGITNSISVKGSIDATEDDSLASIPYSSYNDWQDFQEQQGICLLRLPMGRWYNALCTKCAIGQEDEYDFTRSVDLSFEEVSI